MSNKPSRTLFTRNPSGASQPVPTAKSLTGQKDTKRRMWGIGGAIVGVVVIATSLAANDNKSSKPVAAKPKQEAGLQVDSNPTTARQDNEAFGHQVTSEIGELRAKLGELATKNAQLTTEVSALKAAGNAAGPGTGGALPTSTPPGIVTPPQKGQATSTASTIPPSPPMPPKAPTAPNTVGSVGLPSAAGTVAGSPTSASAYTAESTPSTSVATPARTVNKSGPSAPQIYELPESGSSNSASSEQSVAGQTGVKAKLNYVKNTHFGEIPMGAFAPVVLLNGVDAGTSQTSRADPQPVLISILDHAILPGGSSFKLKSCFAMGTATGSASTERADIRVDQLSCTDKNNKFVLNQKISGYLVDDDGMIGLRGAYIEKQGAKLSRGLLAGFAQGLTTAMGTAQSAAASTITSTGSTSATTINSGAILRSSAFQGAGTAIGQLADMYMKEAASLFPVITVPNGRVGSLVFSAPVVLEWHQAGTKYISEVTPDAKSSSK